MTYIDMDELIRYKRNSLLANLCKEWDGMWSACHNDKEKLMMLVLSRQAAPHFATFCYNGKGLTREYCLREFGEYVKGMKFDGVDGVDGYTSCMYVDAGKDVVGDADTTQMLWCKGTDVTVPETKCGAFYVSNRSSVRFTLSGYNAISIYLFDDSVVKIDDADDTCDVIVYKYSNRADVETGRFCFAKVKIFSKTLRL